MRTCTRRLEFDAAHRVTRHGSKCRNLHGHRYVAEITVGAASLDDLGMVVDFGDVKLLVGGWIDRYWDHGAILKSDDPSTLREVCLEAGWKLYVMDGEPTAENMAEVLHGVACTLLQERGLEVVKVRLYETPNCWSEYP